MKLPLFLLTASLLVTLAACDEGRLDDSRLLMPDRTGIAACVDAPVLRTDGYDGTGYTLALAGFAPGSDYAEVCRNITADDLSDSGVLTVTLSDIPASVTQVRLCVLDRLRKQVSVFVTADCTDTADTLRLRDVPSDLSLTGALSNRLFTPQCVACHGDNGHKAAGLDLTAGAVERSLLMVPSRKMPGWMLVVPGHYESSVLHRVLSTHESSTWAYDHSSEIADPALLTLIEHWIQALGR